jgi:protein kinase
MAELYLGRPLFPGRTESEQLMTIVTVLGTPTQIEWPEGHQIARAKGITFPNVIKQNAIQELLEPAGANLQAINLLQQMLKFDSNRRITAGSALRHNFFNNVPPIPKDDRSVSTM